jgi:hypothetical protein
MTEHKPGYKTSEFWLTFAAMLVGTLIAADVVAEGTAAFKILGLAAGILAALGYTVSRAFVKGAEAKADAAESLARIAAETKPDPSSR